MPPLNGPTGMVSRAGIPLVVTRKPFLDLSPHDISRIRDETLRKRLIEKLAGKQKRAFREALLEFARDDRHFAGIRRVRLVATMQTIGIADAHGRIYKCYKGDGNHRADIWQLECGKWVSEVITMFEAHRAGRISKIRRNHHNPSRVMSLYRNDMIAYEAADGTAIRSIARVVKFSRDGRITLAEHFEAGNLKARDRNRNDPFRYTVMAASTLMKRQARKIRVDECGRVFDPGPRS